jgi:signal transduction histidine kinase
MTKLFSKFVTNSSKGPGLGLYISKSIIEAHGVKIWAENNSDGIGATLTFSMPISQKVEQLKHERINLVPYTLLNFYSYFDQVVDSKWK